MVRWGRSRYRGCFGPSGEVGHESAEAVNGDATPCSSLGALGERSWRTLRLGDCTLAHGLGGVCVIVVVENRGETGAQVPFEVVSERAEEQVSADAFLQPMIDRPDMEIDGLQTTKARSRSHSRHHLQVDEIQRVTDSRVQGAPRSRALARIAPWGNRILGPFGRR
jgi:hypothetical protein